ncbi:MAG: helix-turn-helix domain-containing protein [Muribaculaceae bacterium]|nr:helix-turn-helix domain-containing protein [Muribaculaceae bacterium]
MTEHIKALLQSDVKTPVSITLTADDLQKLIKQTVAETVASLDAATEAEIVWLTPKQVSERLNKDRVTLWRWDKEGYLSGVKFGNRVRYKLSDVERIEAAEK